MLAIELRRPSANQRSINGERSHRRRSSGRWRFLLRQRRPIGVGLFQISFDILVPKFPSLLVVLQDQAIMQHLEVLDLDRRKLVDRRGVTTESPKLRFIFCRRALELLLMLGGRELIGRAFVAGGEFTRTFDRFSVGKISDRVVALKSQTALVDVDDFGGRCQNSERNEPRKIEEKCIHDRSSCSWLFNY